MKIVLFVLLAVLAGFTAIAPIIYIKRKFGGNLKRVRDGVAVYVIFASLLNAVIYTVAAVGFELEATIEKNYWSSAIISALLLTFCSCTGSVIWLKGVIKEKGEISDALLYGAGYSSAYMVLSYVFSSIANAVISIMVAINKNASISDIFESNIAQVANTDAYTLFLEILQMLLTFVFEGAICVVFYRVILCKDKKRWLAAAVLLHFLANGVIRFHGIERSFIILIFLALTVTASGLAYSLIFPTKKKENNE